MLPRLLPRLLLRFFAFTTATVLAVHAQAQPVPDTLAQRVQACTACHGAQGRAAPDGYYPRIAGKPAGYLAQQLLHFRDGRRHHRLMTHMVTPLSDAYLHELAGHFAALDLPYPAPLPSPAPGEWLARGQKLAQEGDASRQLPACAACHGASLTGVQPATPGLLGLPRDYLNAQLGAWRTGARRATHPDCMAQVARQLSLDDVAAVSAWLASRPLPADTHAARRLPAPPPLRCGSLAEAGALQP